jgi:predicted secreted protein
VVGSTAYASDSSQLNPIGFSRDGKIFAYEEYGVQDGSGFAYSNIFFIDTDVDKHLPGTPIKVLVENDESVARIRKLARDKAAPLIAQYDLENNPGKIVAYNPVTEVDSDPHRLRYYEYYSLLSRSGSFTIELKEKPFPAPKNCLNMTGDFKGFSLTFTEVSSEATTRLIHEDIQVPASRNCPNGYRLGAIVTSDVDAAATIAMIQVSTFGFEGNDERWIAVTARLLERPQ